MQFESDDADELNKRGNTLRALLRRDEALACYDRALILAPAHGGALYNRGNLLLELGRPTEAIASFDLVLAQCPSDAEAHFHRGNALMALQRYDEALSSFDRALALDPEAAIVQQRRGNALRELGHADEALACYERAQLSGAVDADALVHRGVALQDLGRHAEALECYDQARLLRPHDLVTLNNRGNALRELRRPAEALESYGEALAFDPGNPAVQYNRSLCHLLVGDFVDGWREYECRWRGNAIDSPKRDFPQPLWLGEAAISGKTILLHAEQGLGDTLQFCRYAKLVADAGATVVLQVQAPLKRLLAPLAGASAVLDGGDALPAFDYHCPLLSLPLAFGTRLETVPGGVPYVHGEPACVARWRDQLGPTALHRIGIVWSGSIAHKHDRARSIPLAAFDGLRPERAQLVSLQFDVRPADATVLEGRSDITHIGDRLADFTDTAAAVALMDLVVTADTSVAHLAGAMGKPVWILLPFNPDWRWLLDRDNSPWYPSARLFRQDSPRNWGSIIERVASELDAHLKAKGPLARAFHHT